MAFRLPPQPPENDSTEWVLFSPSQPSVTAHTHTTSTEHTPRTAGASRLSDFGSFGTVTRSALGPEQEDDADDLDDVLDEDGTELDSLDDGLHAFRAPEVDQGSASKWDQGDSSVLPAHDGLGSFQASSQTVQDQLWQHEQYNPRRRPELRLRRHSSVQRQLDAMVDNDRTDAERDRWQRIERWRMDQSRMLLNEIEKETRKRRSSCAGVSSSDRAMPPSVTPDTPRSIPEAAPAEKPQEGDPESLWQRITRKVIRDLIGIDDSLLSVIFGESLVDTDHDAQRTSTGTSQPFDLNEALNRELGSVPDDQNQWQSKLLQRIAHELGVLVHQLCEHPGAFTTYLNVSNDAHNQYAGIPLSRVPEEGAEAPDTTVSTRPESSSKATGISLGESMPSPHFSPTIRSSHYHEHAAQWGIEDDADSSRAAEPLSESARVQHEKEYWERELDVMMVFRYLRNRFSHRSTTSDSHHTTSRRPPQDASRRAAVIRQHHPLVARAHSRSQAQARRQSQCSANGAGSTGVSSPILRQHFRRSSSSCASQSAKRSAISSRRTLTSSSRNYWDIGGSVDSGSAVVPVSAGVPAWGDV
ncbi:hypothetical protein P168DRAFT_300439 [Aspergillus campestris IBT 28561]|uniref:Uncharacterized protein n=1 Tax=Aspergillus campestris (strain IBT 28561) TaxID=1392248 RepID=A0A2I1CQH5_ASPC2|nr:uncharacterized protein P168DRAFT_300439 [Aspergillus campestris IBT 28561]PKX99879.1 hypothetical protein P168DRAFT_300439 [Aspergillus campestris IBT 28561]